MHLLRRQRFFSLAPPHSPPPLPLSVPQPWDGETGDGRPEEGSGNVTPLYFLPAVIQRHFNGADNDILSALLGINLSFSDDAMGLRGIYTGLTTPKDAPAVDLEDSGSAWDFLFSIIYTRYSHEPKHSPGSSKKKKRPKSQGY